MSTKAYPHIDTVALLKSVQERTATPEETILAAELTAAIRQAKEGGDLTGDQIAILKAAELIGEAAEVEPEPAAAPAAAVPGAAQPPAGTPPAAAVPRESVLKHVELPNPAALTEAAAAQGATLDVSPILLAMNQSYERVAKALEVQNELLDEQNALLAAQVEHRNADAAVVQKLSKNVDAMAATLESLITTGEDGQVTVLKSLMPGIATGLEDALRGLSGRVGEVEGVLNRRPHATNPPRGVQSVTVLKGLAARDMGDDGDVLYPRAIELIQKSVTLDRYDKQQALADLDSARGGGIPYAAVLERWDVLGTAQAAG